MAAEHRRADRGAGARLPAPAPSPRDCLSAEFVAEARPGSGLPSPTLPEVAFAGRSNVGKSTLLNRICQRRSLARTSRTPGCTRGVVIYRCALRDGTTLHLADLPGYGFAERSHDERRAWARHIEDFVQRRASLRGVFVLVDARRGVEDEELQLMEWLRAIHRPYAVVATKIDKVPRNERGRALAAIRTRARAEVVPTSAETGEGRDELMRALVAMLPRDIPPAHEGTATAEPAVADVVTGTTMAQPEVGETPAMLRGSTYR